MKKYLPFALRIIVAIILIQTLRFKFTAHPDSVYIFETMGMEPYGRIMTGIFELLAGILLLFRKTAWIGAGLTIGIIGGAIVSHLFILGITVNNDGGLLFITAVITFILATAVLYIFKEDIPYYKKIRLRRQ